MGRLKKVVLIIIAAVGLGFGGMSAWFAQSVNGEEAARRFIAANPLDLSQIEAFSKYRSCMGHDFRAPNLSGEKEATPRSMKHYVMVKPEFHGTIDKVSAFAPFDGIISVVDDNLGGLCIVRRLMLLSITQRRMFWMSTVNMESAPMI